MKVLGVILAGGLSTRMGGQDKALLDLSGSPLIKHAIDRLENQVDGLVEVGVLLLQEVLLIYKKPLI